MGKRIMITLTDEQYEILRQMREFGNTDAERLRNVFLAFASEKGYMKRWREGREGKISSTQGGFGQA